LKKPKCVNTGNSPVILVNIGTIIIQVFIKYKKGTFKYNNITFLNTLYIPNFLINIINKYKFYTLKSTFIKEKFFLN